MKNTDILIIGSGIGGLSLAAKINSLNPELKICIITKSDAIEGNTRYAQGGVAAVMDTINDSFEDHINDTLKCGAGLCDKAIVEMVVRKAPERIKELIQLGVQFDKKSNGNIHLALEGGHVAPRIAHHKDKTGFEIETVLLSRVQKCKNIKIIPHQLVVDLIIEEENGIKKCSGVSIYEDLKDRISHIYASVTVLATGGCGQVYKNTTNPKVATGDGFAMAYRAGAELQNMRFEQFHPTSLYEEKHNEVSFLISEAVRGFGAHIIDADENRFLFAYDKRGELATRDIISAAIFEHMQAKKAKHVYLDMRHLNVEAFENHFPIITEKLKELGYNFSFDLIPIVPSAHYQSGGIKVNSKAQTNIDNLYALGEVSCTGLHGANRLASNSLLEALVFSHEAALEIVNTINVVEQPTKETYQKTIDYADNTWVQNEIEILKEMMSSVTFQSESYNYNNVLDNIQYIIERTERETNQHHFSNELLTLRNLAITANIIVKDLVHSHKVKLKMAVEAI